MSDDEPCIRCGHPADHHDPDLVYCLGDGCLCLAYISQADELESALASGDEIEPLNFDEDGS